jgi:hypothetical protein
MISSIPTGNTGPECPDISFASGYLGFLLQAHKPGDGDCRQYTYDNDNHDQFDKRKTFSFHRLTSICFEFNITSPFVKNFLKVFFTF